MNFISHVQDTRKTLGKTYKTGTVPCRGAGAVAMLKKYPLLLLLALTLLLPACASQTGSSYNRSQTREAMSVEYGVITQLNDAIIEDDPQGLGTLGGGVLGGVLGSGFGGGKARIFTAAGGAIIGAILGTGIEKSMNTKAGQEIMVKLDSGRTIVVVQEIDNNELLVAGDRVRVLSAPDGSARVRLE